MIHDEHCNYFFTNITFFRIFNLIKSCSSRWILNAVGGALQHNISILRKVQKLFFISVFLVWFFKGSFASLTAVFSFRRRTESFISSIFVPSIVLVVLSWCCFYISPAAVPARVALSITTILTSILLKGNVNRDMPKVSYMKAVDYFMLTSFGFIFAALIEYIIVLNSDPVLPSWCKRRQKMDEKQKFTVVSEVSKEKSGLIKKKKKKTKQTFSPFS